MNSSDLLPCATCPWRVDKDARTIPGYDHDLAEKLRDTVGEEDGFRTIMACHHSHPGQSPQERVCKGYLAQAGWSNINVRIAVLDKKMATPDEVQEACANAGVKLEPDYPAVLQKLGDSLDDF